jgi:hypothetical protein
MPSSVTLLGHFAGGQVCDRRRHGFIRRSVSARHAREQERHRDRVCAWPRSIAIALVDACRCDGSGFQRRLEQCLSPRADADAPDVAQRSTTPCTEFQLADVDTEPACSSVLPCHRARQLPRDNVWIARSAATAIRWLTSDRVRADPGCTLRYRETPTLVRHTTARTIEIDDVGLRGNRFPGSCTMTECGRGWHDDACVERSPCLPPGAAPSDQPRLHEPPHRCTPR